MHHNTVVLGTLLPKIKIKLIVLLLDGTSPTVIIALNKMVGVT
jgi:hypothetical protein